MSDTTRVERLRTVPADVACPADKAQLVDHASRNKADEDTVHALHAVPERLYESFDDVLDVVAVDESREA